MQRISTGLPLSWFVFNVDLMSPPGTNMAPFYKYEVNGAVSVFNITHSRDSNDRITSMTIPGCGIVTVTYDVDGIIDSVSDNAMECTIKEDNHCALVRMFFF